MLGAILYVAHVQYVTTCLALAFACLLCFVVLLFSLSMILEIIGQALSGSGAGQAGSLD